LNQAWAIAARSAIVTYKCCDPEQIFWLASQEREDVGAAYETQYYSCATNPQINDHLQIVS
jgi:hypothetical protein